MRHLLASTLALLLVTAPQGGCDRDASAPSVATTTVKADPAATPGAAVSPDAEGSAQNAPLQERLAQARKLLEDAGFPGGKGLPKIEILYNTQEGHKKIAAAIQQMWRKNLGIEVELRNTEWKVYLDDLSKLRYQIARRGWIADYMDPSTFTELFASWSGNNNTGWSDPEFDRLIKASASETDPAKRFRHLEAAEAILMRDLPVIPLYFYVTKNVWKETVKGLHHTPLDIHVLNGAYAEGKDTLIINNAAEPQTVDPTLARGQPEHRITIALFEGLMAYDAKTLEPRPGVAERWEVTPDGKTYTFHLRDCEWSDGRKISAQDFVYAWTRILDPATPTDYAHLLYFIKGAEAFNQKKSSDPSTLGFRAVDDRTLAVELDHPCTFFLSLCCYATYAPLRKDLVEKHGQKWTQPENFVGNGPFTLKEWKLNDSITLERNPKYWNREAVKSPYIKFLPIDNASTAWNLYKKGEIDFITDLPLEQIEEIIKRPDYRGDTFLATYFYSFNVTDPALKDRRVRKALALAIDREIIAEKITKQGQKPAYFMTPPVFGDYNAPRFDVKD